MRARGFAAVLAGLGMSIALAASAPAQVVTPYGERAVTPKQGAGAPSAAAPRAQGESKAPAPSTGAHFLAIKGGTGADSESGFIPPDTTGAVGPANIVVPLNGRIKIFSRTGVEQYSATLNDFFSSVLPSGNAFDPRVEYDAITGRWFVIAINGGGDNTVMLATSNGSNVAAGESAFTFRSFVHSAVLPAAAGAFADYPTLATDANSILIGTNNFAGSPRTYHSSSLFALDKADLIAGTIDAKGWIVGDEFSGMFTPQVAENDRPGAGTSYVVGVDNAAFSVLDFRRITYPGGVPTLSSQIQFAVDPTAFSTDDVPAMGSTINVDALDDRLYEAMVAIDPATGQERLWTAHNMEMNVSGSRDERRQPDRLALV